MWEEVVHLTPAPNLPTTTVGTSSSSSSTQAASPSGPKAFGHRQIVRRQGADVRRRPRHRVQDKQVAAAVEPQARRCPELSPIGRVHVTHPEQLDELRGQGTIGVQGVIRHVGAGTRRNGQRQGPGEGPHGNSSAHGVLLVDATGVVAFGVGTLVAASGSMTLAMRGLVAAGLGFGFEGAWEGTEWGECGKGWVGDGGDRDPEGSPVCRRVRPGSPGLKQQRLTSFPLSIEGLHNLREINSPHGDCCEPDRICAIPSEILCVFNTSFHAG